MIWMVILKGETFYLTLRSLIIQITAQTHNLFDLSGSSYFEIPHERF